MACGECYAEFTGQPCWELWAARPAAAKPCCRKEERCEVCPVFQARTAPQPVEAGGVHEPGIPTPSRPDPRSIRVCPSLRVATLPAGDPHDPGDVSLVRATLRTEADVACRCTARGAALVADYVRAVCVSAMVDDCAFRDPDTALEASAARRC